MATAKTPADTIAERRLRPIYDWLDVGNNKKAIQEADRLLKKQSDFKCAKVLKSLAMIRLGKSRESEELLEIVEKDVPSEDSTLQAMSMCYREINKMEKICDIYERAIAKDPTNEEFFTHLFMSYVRIGDHKKQQQCALNLYKVKPKNPYYFWAVMSMVMQAKNDHDEVTKKLKLQLAERMIKKFMDEDKIEAEPELQLYIMILEMQENYKDALRILESDLARKSIPDHIYVPKRVSLLKKLDKWYTLNAYLKSLLLEELDAYNYYVLYIESVFKMLEDSTFSNWSDFDLELTNEYEDNNNQQQQQNTEINIDQPDNSLKTCIAFLNHCQEKNMKSKHRLRGPYLSRLLLCRKLMDIDEKPSNLQLGINAVQIISNYFSQFGEKSCFMKDLYPFLTLVKNESDVLLEKLWKQLDVANKDNLRITKKQTLMYFSYYQLKMYFGKFDEYNVEQKIKEASKLTRYYHDCNRFNVNLLPTDLRFNDMLIILAAHMLYNTFLETGDHIIIRDALCIVEYGYWSSSANYHLKLLLLKLYNTIGAAKAAYKYYDSLDIRHMQYESLGYLILWTLLSVGKYDIAKQLMKNTLKFFNSNYKETADQLAYAYKFGSFEKVLEITKFQEKLKNSYHYVLVNVEHTFMSMVQAASHNLTIQTMEECLPETEKDLNIDYDVLCDNRDPHVFICFNPPHRRVTEKYLKTTFEHDVTFLKIRSLMLRCLISCLNVELHLLERNNATNHITNNHNHNNSINNSGIQSECSSLLSKFHNLTNELADLYKLLLNDPPKETPKEIYAGIEKSRLFTYIRCPHSLPLFIDIMSMMHLFYKQFLLGDISEPEVKDKMEIVIKKFQNLIESCKCKIEREISDKRKFGTQSDTIQMITLTCETVCILGVMCGVLYSLLMQSQNSVKKKKKQKDSNENFSSSVAVVSQSNMKSSENNISKKSNLGKIYMYFVSTIVGYIKSWNVHLEKFENSTFELDNDGLSTKLLNLKDEIKEPPSLDNAAIDKWRHLLRTVNDHITISYKSSVKEIRTIVSQKTDYISHLEL